MLRTAWQFARRERRRFLLIYAMFIAANLVVALNPLLYGWFVDALQQRQSEVLSFAWLYAGAYLGLKLLEWMFHGPARVMERKLAFNLSRNFLNDMYQKVLHLPVSWHQENHSGSTINRLRKAYDALKEFFQHGFVYLQVMGKFFFSVLAIVYFSPVFGSIGIGIGLFTIWVIFKFDKPFVRALHEQNEKEHLVSSTLFDSLSNIITVITLRLESRIQSRLIRKVKHVFPAFKRQITINEWKWFTANMLVALIYVVVVLGYIYQHWTPGQTFLIGGLVTLLAFVNQFTSVFYDIANQYTKIVQYNTDLQAAKGISTAYAQYSRPEAGAPLPDQWKTLAVEGLSFTYRGTSRQRMTGLENIHLHIRRGGRVALIGESGSGKSTLLALLRGLHLAQPGAHVAVDGDHNFSLASITNTVTLFPQEPEIFENTIRYNITLGLPFSDEEIMAVCETAHFAEVVKHLPQGLATNIQEKGVNLSGGQKQRLALARGILAARTSQIILMDEPTSSVDPRTEMQVYQRLFHAFADKAIISSLHRLNLLHMFDYIYILDKGSIVAEGTFTSLRATSSTFNDLWRHQQDEEGLLLTT